MLLYISPGSSSSIESPKEAKTFKLESSASKNEGVKISPVKRSSQSLPAISKQPKPKKKRGIMSLISDVVILVHFLPGNSLSLLFFSGEVIDMDDEVLKTVKDNVQQHLKKTKPLQVDDKNKVCV